MSLLSVCCKTVVQSFEKVISDCGNPAQIPVESTKRDIEKSAPAGFNSCRVFCCGKINEIPVFPMSKPALRMSVNVVTVSGCFVSMVASLIFTISERSACLLRSFQSLLGATFCNCFNFFTNGFIIFFKIEGELFSQCCKCS